MFNNPRGVFSLIDDSSPSSTQGTNVLLEEFGTMNVEVVTHPNLASS